MTSLPAMLPTTSFIPPEGDAKGKEHFYPSSFKDLKKAMSGFNEKNRLGQGGFGVVYRGLLVKENKEIAVKWFSRDSIKGQDDFLAELTIINRLRHKHLVKLLRLMEAWMERVGMGLLWLILLLHPLRCIHANVEGDALIVFKNGLIDQQKILESWDQSSDPCGMQPWIHVTCNADNKVTSLDLKALTILESLNLTGNKLSGIIPWELGEHSKLITILRKD